MRKFLAIIAAKILRFIGKLIGRGSSLPGKYALKIDPDILRKIKLPEHVIAVTGSNGKTSTVEMIAYILEQNGISVAYNKLGSNQIEGVTTTLLEFCTLRGKIKTQVVLLESDEQYARHTFQYIHPSHLVITNLYRDQLTRNGHPEWIYRLIEECIPPETKLLLNCDDPLVSCFANKGNEVTWFGVDPFETTLGEVPSVYDDGAFCPVCKKPMAYEYRHYNHIGKFSCPHCGFAHQEPVYRVTEVHLEEGYFIIDGQYRISMRLKSIYNVYNILAAFAVCDLEGVPKEAIAATIDNYTLKSGRVVTYRVGDHDGMLLVSKHENSISYNQSLRVAAADTRDCTAVVLVDAISRKYFTGDTSWLWDIDFHLLASEAIKKIVLMGNYCQDLAVRFSYTDIAPEKIIVIRDIEEGVHFLEENAVGYLYTITCFSDKDKFLSKVEVKQS